MYSTCTCTCTNINFGDFIFLLVSFLCLYLSTLLFLPYTSSLFSSLSFLSLSSTLSLSLSLSLSQGSLNPDSLLNQITMDQRALLGKGGVSATRGPHLSCQQALEADGDPLVSE